MRRKHSPLLTFPAVCALAAVLLLALAACGGNGDSGETPTTPPSSTRATPNSAGSPISTAEPPASPASTVRPPPAETSPETDREALVAFYNATDGETWDESGTWLSNAPIGEWEGVTTDESGRVMELDLSSYYLSGEIPPDLGNLAELKYLGLVNNQLSGCIPSSLQGQLDPSDLGDLPFC